MKPNVFEPITTFVAIVGFIDVPTNWPEVALIFLFKSEFTQVRKKQDQETCCVKNNVLLVSFTPNRTLIHELNNQNISRIYVLMAEW